MLIFTIIMYMNFWKKANGSRAFFQNINFNPVAFVKKSSFIQAVTLNDVCIVDGLVESIDLRYI